MKIPPIRSFLASRAGVTLVELIVAMTMMAVITAAIGVSLGKQRSFGRDSHRQGVAQMLARNEIEALRAAGPLNAAAWVGTRTVNSAGDVLPSGGDPGNTYTIVVTSQTLCEGGERVPDQIGGPQIPSAGCLDRRAILTYRVRVSYPSRRGPQQVVQDLRLGESERFGGTRTF